MSSENLPDESTRAVDNIIDTGEPDPVHLQVAGELAKHLYADILNDKCVFFIGAGSTTERVIPGRKGGFYASVLATVSSQVERPTLAFPDLMQLFCETQDGGQKNRLISKALEYIESFCLPEEQNSTATQVSKQLARIPLLKRFVTTNWDPFLERSLDVLVPMIEDRDLAFWDDQKRQVLKIHGCISRPYSIVATRSDYTTCASANPLLFNKLRDLMATKTFIFLGYGLRDSDFETQWTSVTSRLGSFARLAYAINPFAAADDISHWKQKGVEIVLTSDVAFTAALRSLLERNGKIPSPELLRHLQEERDRILGIHLAVTQNSDAKFASAMYQDGLLEALGDVLHSALLGTRQGAAYESDLHDAEGMLRTAIQANDVIEIAYWTGHQVVLSTFCHRSLTSIPAYINPKTLQPTHRLSPTRKWPDLDGM